MRILRLQQLAYSSLGCLALILGTASAGLAQSCPGFIDVPLTKNRLNQIAAINGIPFNQIGKAFENFALATIDPNAPIPSNTKRFPSTERGAATDGEFQNVIPDGIFPLTVKQPGAPDLIFNESVFYEAKALQPQSITPEYPVNPNDEDGDTGRYQILGFLDALRNSPAGQGGTGIPALIFLTTSGVTVDFETRAEAFFKGVAVWQSVACETIGFGQTLQMSEAIVTNPEVYVFGLTIPGPVGPGIPGTITQP